MLVASLLVQLLSISNHLSFASSFVAPSSSAQPALTTRFATTATSSTDDAVDSASSSSLFDDFASFLITKQSQIIGEIEQLESEYSDKGDEHKFSKDCWGVFSNENDDSANAKNIHGSGGITRKR